MKQFFYFFSYFMGCIALVRFVGVTLWFGCGVLVMKFDLDTVNIGNRKWRAVLKS